MKKILILDDDHSIRELYRYIFIGLGYSVETAENGRDGFDKMRNFEPDCILVDISMPVMSGDEFAQKLRDGKNPRWREIPFFVLTGENPADVAIQQAFRGNPACKAFLPKLNTPDAVAHMVKLTLDATE